MSRILLLLLLAAGCSGGGPPAGARGFGARPEPVTVVEVEEAGRGEVAETLRTSATVESERAASLFPEATGVVREIHADVGDHVRAGQVLAVLENVSLDATAERADVELSRLEKKLAELEELAARGAVSARELEDARYELKTARASAREARSSFGNTRITAPFDGVVAQRSIRVGELASSGAAAFEVVDLTALRVVAALPERDLPRVAVGQPARLSSAYDPDAAAHGVVRRIAPVVDSASGTFRVTIEVEEGGNLRPGQFVTVDLEVDRRRDVIVVPKRALVYEDGRPVIYTMIEASAEDLEKMARGGKAGKGGGPPGRGGKAKGQSGFASWFGKEPPKPPEKKEPEGPRYVADRISVDLGLVDDVNAEIQAGLQGGERVIVLGQNHLRDGARVRTIDPADAPAEAEAEATAGTDDPERERG